MVSTEGSRFHFVLSNSAQSNNMRTVSDAICRVWSGSLVVLTSSRAEPSAMGSSSFLWVLVMIYLLTWAPFFQKSCSNCFHSFIRSLVVDILSPRSFFLFPSVPQASSVSVIWVVLLLLCPFASVPASFLAFICLVDSNTFKMKCSSVWLASSFVSFSVPQSYHRMIYLILPRAPPCRTKDFPGYSGTTFSTSLPVLAPISGLSVSVEPFV